MTSKRHQCVVSSWASRSSPFEKTTCACTDSAHVYSPGTAVQHSAAESYYHKLLYPTCRKETHNASRNPLATRPTATVKAALHHHTSAARPIHQQLSPLRHVTHPQLLIKPMCCAALLINAAAAATCASACTHTPNGVSAAPTLATVPGSRLGQHLLSCAVPSHPQHLQRQLASPQK